MAPCFHSFLTLPDTLSFEAGFTDTDELLMVVPQHGSELHEFASPQSSLDLTDLLLDIRTPEAYSSDLEATSRPPPQLTQFQESKWQQHTQPAARPATAPQAPCTLKLRLDCDAVLAAWRSQGLSCHPFQLHGAQLAVAAAAIPSASAGTAAACHAAQCAPPPPAAVHHRRSVTTTGPQLVPALTVRKRFTADNRPRSKGRFMSRAEWDRTRAAQAAQAAA